MPIRRTAYVIPPDDSDTHDSSSDDSVPLAKPVKNIVKKEKIQTMKITYYNDKLHRRMRIRADVYHDSDSDDTESGTENDDSE